MNDFRSQLYRRYVSTFKGDKSRRTGRADAFHRAWCERKCYPLLRHIDPDAPILEVGCGSGDLLAFLRDKGFTNARGIDISEEQVAIARQRGLDAAVEDVFDTLNDASERFRVIFAIDFIEHFSREELTHLVPSIYQALQEGGLLILQTPNGQGLFPGQVIHGDLSHMTIFTPGSLSQLLRPEGFEDFRFAEIGPMPRNVIGVLRLGLWKMIRAAANAVRMIEAGKSQDIWTETVLCVCRKPPV